MERIFTTTLATPTIALMTPMLSSPYYSDARHGSVSVGTASFSQGGPIYGNVTTNGGNVTHANTNISGTIDNTVPFTIPPLVIPDTTTFTAASGTTLNVDPTRTTGTSAVGPCDICLQFIKPVVSRLTAKQ